jgi:plastocyanin
MKRTFSAVLAVATLGLVGATFALARPAATPKLTGTVGPGFTISLTSKGKKVKTLKPGRYKFAISDKASIHNFVLEQETGGKFERDLTTLPFTGTKTATVTLKKGKWKYYCMAHESSMFGFFVVK